MVVVVSSLIPSNCFSRIKKISASEWKGIASYYHFKFDGRKTSTGEIFKNSSLTCANNFLPLGTYILVSNVKNGKSVVVRVNDRMHPNNHRLIDLSRAAASRLGMLSDGLGEVHIMVLSDTDGSLARN